MNTNQDIGPRVRSWLHERLTERPDPYPILDEVMSQLPTAPQRRHRWWPVPMSNRKTKTMSSALKFVAAGVIVALFSGFLLAGILTTQQNDEALPAAVTESPSPMTTEELLPGVTLTIEGVEPGVYRVTNDGVRDLASVDAVDIVTGYDGGIWLLREDAFLRLGNDGSHQWPMDSGPEDHAFEVAPDGTMWVIPCGARPFHKQCGDARRSTDGEEWTVQPCPQGSTDCQGFMVAPDGTVWASWRVEWGRWRVGHLGPTGWQPLDGYARSDCTEAPFSGYRRMFVTDAGDIYGLDKCDIFRFEDGGWEFFSYQPSWSPSEALVGVGPDGTVWLGFKDDDRLSRWADGRWEDWDPATFLPDTRFAHGGVDEFRVAPDGSLWFGLWHWADGTKPRRGGHLHYWEEEGLTDAVEDGRMACDGLARFDGSPLGHFLRGQCISSMDIAPGGSVWVLASDSRGGTEPSDLYVITPEAVAASE